MARIIIWSPIAADDLEEIWTYIARSSITYASNVIQQILDSVEPLEDSPMMGRSVPEMDDENIRELIVYSYRVIYRVQDQRITIAAVVHGARQLSNALRGRSI